ncbi:MAG: hypothetical protein GQF41_4502 [Candidatus Rifleibacterium amylolyticum]|nr:MAG: hypothetical protein GQF41_4502 [Candidatus Rifleibacterium amylolyticum]
MSEELREAQSDKILVVDDAAVNLQLLIKILSSQGYSVYPASDGELALRFVQTTIPDLILLDINMPGMDGFEVCRRLKADQKTCSVPIIFISILEDERDKVKGFQAGGVDYITKPFQPEEVLARVRTHLRLQKLTTQLEHEVRERTAELAITNKRLQEELIERRRAEELLRKSEERYRLVFENSPVPIWEENFADVKAFFDDLRKQGVTDIEPYFTQHPEMLRHCAELTKIVDVNKAAISLHRAQSREELLTGLIGTFISESFDTFRYELVCLWNGVKEIATDAIVKTIGGEQKNVTVYCNVCPGSEETLAKVFVSLIDVTERKKLEEQLRQSQKLEAVGQLAGGIAHDFNNMLIVIIGYAEVVLHKMTSDNPLRDHVVQIKLAGERSADITRQLLTFARKQAIEPKILNLNLAVEGIIKLLRRLIGEDIDLAWLPCENLWPVRMDPSQVDQVLANLCVNAKDAIAGVGKITIETQNISVNDTLSADIHRVSPGSYVVLSVSDNGKGMSRETISKIFEPFFSTKELGKGTGLGLATVYGIAKQNSGFINVYSEPGYGSCFKLYLPAFACKDEDLHAKKAAEKISRGNETILVVEDDASVLNLVKMMLENCGYRVLGALTPEEAMRITKEMSCNIDLLLTDVVMPGMTGKSLADELCACCPKLRCLFMSGYTGNVVMRQGLINGGTNFIHKPFSLQQMATRVRDVLDHE